MQGADRQQHIFGKFLQTFPPARLIITDSDRPRYWRSSGVTNMKSMYRMSKQLISYPLKASVYCHLDRTTPKPHCRFATASFGVVFHVISFCVKYLRKETNWNGSLVFCLRSNSGDLGILRIDPHWRKQSDESREGSAWREWSGDFHDCFRWWRPRHCRSSCQGASASFTGRSSWAGQIYHCSVTSAFITLPSYIPC